MAHPSPQPSPLGDSSAYQLAPAGFLRAGARTLESEHDLLRLVLQALKERRETDGDS
jgi:hypothetical protein